MKVSTEALRVSQAQAELELLINKFANKHDLSDIEVLQALNSYTQTTLKYMLRYERHGNYDTPAMRTVDKE